MTNVDIDLRGDVDEAFLSQVRVSGLAIEEFVGLNFSTTITFESLSPNLNHVDWLGKGLAVSFPKSVLERWFHGVVTRFERVGDKHANLTQYKVLLQPWAKLLDFKRDRRIYQDMSVLEILRDVFARTEHPAVSFDMSKLSSNYPKLTYCVQFDESDLEFVSRLMEREGIYCYYEHTAAGHKLNLCDSIHTHLSKSGYETVPYHPTVNRGALVQNEYISTISHKIGLHTAKVCTRDFAFEVPDEQLQAESVSGNLDFNREFEWFEYPGLHSLERSAMDVARLRAEELHGQAERLHGSGPILGLACGYIFEPLSANLPFGGRQFMVLSTRIHISQRRSESGGHAGFSFDTIFVACPSKLPYRPPRNAPRPRVFGHQTAIVVGPKGDEIHTDQFGRVRVYFPWDRHAKVRDATSCWIRVAYPIAGDGWGFVSTPRVGQEVVIEFEEGNPDRPLIVGVVYNGSHKTPYELPSYKNVSGYRSHSTLAGGTTEFNELRFDDTKGKEYVWLQAQRDFNSFVKRNSHAEVGSDAYLKVKGNAFSHYEKDVSVEVEGALASQINGKTSLQVESDLSLQLLGQLGVNTRGGVQVKSQSNVEIESSSSQKLASSRSIELSAGQSIVLAAGGSSIKIDPSGIHLVGPNVSVGKGSGAKASALGEPQAPEATSSVGALVDPISPGA